MTKFYEIRKDLEGYRASTPDQLRDELAKLRGEHPQPLAPSCGL